MMRSQPEVGAPTTDTKPLSKGKAALIWLSIVCGVLCPFLDEGIIATAIPQITDDFKSLSDVGWYGSAYFMSMAASQLIFGRLYANFNAKTIFLISLAVFEAGSLIAGASPSSRILIVGRSIAGIGSAGLNSGVIALFELTLPRQQLPLYMGAMGTVYGIAAVLGPVVGGVITNSHLTWRWCFYINLPVAIPPVVASIFLVRIPPRSDTDESGAKRSVLSRLGELDYFGMVLLVPGITCLLVALEFGGVLYSWGDGRTIGSFVTAGVLIILFVLWQWWISEKALLPPRIISNRLVLSCSFFTCCIESAFVVIVYALPNWFQTIQQVSAGESGIRYLPFCICYCVFTVICGWTVSRFGYVQPFMLAGSALVSIAGGLLSTLQVSSGPSVWVSLQIVAGVGIGASTDQPGVAVQRLMSEVDAPLGFATILFWQNLGPAMALSISNSVFLARVTKQTVKTFPNLEPETVVASGANALHELVPPGEVPKLLEIYNNSLTRVFIIVAVVAIASVFGIWGVGTRRLHRPVEGIDHEAEDGVVIEAKS